MTEERSGSANLDWDEDGQPKSSQFGDFYFSTDSGLEESRYVFLKHNDLEARWQKLQAGDNFTVIETGFGSGLNFLACWQAWQLNAHADSRLNFISCEKYPLTKSDLERTLALWPGLEFYSQQLLDHYPAHLNCGFHRLSFGPVSLTLIVGDACSGLSQLKRNNHPLFDHKNRIADAWFLDGFSPAKNPDMWTDKLFDQVAQLSKDGATLATFTAASAIRKQLTAAGFEVKKSRGFGVKREMLFAHFQAPAAAQVEDFKPGAFNSPHPAPWHEANTAEISSKTAIIIGGGLAGCHSARALAERGFKVTIIERHRGLGQEGSGNPQGMLYAKLSPRQESLPNFNLASLMYAQRHYTPFWQRAAVQSPNDGHHCGVLQLAHTDKEQKLHDKLRQQFSDSDLIEFVDPERASEVAAADIELGGIFFPQAGWLSPQAVCRDLCQHDNIEVLQGQAVTALQQGENNHSNWQALTEDGDTIASGAVAIVAAASDARLISQTQFLPLKPIRGQVSYLPTTASSEKLKTVVCAEGYLSPALQATDTTPASNGLGASFNLRETSLELTEQDHQHNIDNLQNHTPKLAQMFDHLDAKQLAGRAAFRCTTPDYLPLVGPVPVVDEFIEAFALLRKNAKSSIPCAGPHCPNLYSSVGYGSRGLAYTPLAAEYLAALICNEPSPLPQSYHQALHPARFIVRDLIRNKI